MLHHFRLYRSGWTEGQLPWPDNQLWASGKVVLFPKASNSLVMNPEFGSAAALYRVRLDPLESAEADWVNWRAILEINNCRYGELPLAWYVGSPADWPSGLARFPESYGTQLPGRPYSELSPRGVWTLAVNRDR